MRLVARGPMHATSVIRCLPALAAAPLLLVACGAGDRGALPGEPAAAAAGRPTAVRMAASQFEPAQIAVSRGATVRWPNADAVPHTVTATSGADFDSGAIEPAGSFAWRAERAGRVSYACAFHPGMTGTIAVR